jgi:hypothetical protein
MSPPGVIRPHAISKPAVEEEAKEGQQQQGTDESDGGAADNGELDGEEELLDMSASSLVSGSDVNLAEGIVLLETNLVRLLPNSLLKSAKYRVRIQALLDALKLRATHAHAEAKARKAALEAAMAAQAAAEASEARYRNSISNLQLDSWGNAAELRADIASLECEIVSRGRLTVEDHASVGQGLAKGIERHDEIDNGALSQLDLHHQSEQALSRLPDNGSVRDTTSKLVFTKFKRLEQLIFLLKRKLAVLENYPRQSEIDARFGGIDALLQRVDELQEEVWRLEARLEGQAVRFKEDALLRPRDLTQCPTPFLHLLIVSLQSTLQTYMRAVDDAIGLARESNNQHSTTRHPLNQLFKLWQTDVEREAKRLEVAAAAGPSSDSGSSSKRGSLKQQDSIAGAMGLKLAQQQQSEKVDVDELWNNLHPLPAAAASSTAVTLSVSSKAARQAQQHADKQAAAVAAAAAAAQQVFDLSAQLSAASLRIASLEFDKEVLERQAQNARWIEEVLRREGIVAHHAASAATAEGKTEAESDDVDSAQQQQQQEQQDENDEETEQQLHERQQAEADESVDWADDGSPQKQKRALEAIDGAEEAEGDGEEEQEPPPTVLRHAITVTAPDGSSDHTHSEPSLQPRGDGVTRVSRGLLRHLHAYRSELSRYRRFVTQYQSLHVSREFALARAENERLALTKVLTHLLRKHPFLADAAAANANASAAGQPTSSRGSVAGQSQSSSRNKPLNSRITSSRQSHAP